MFLPKYISNNKDFFIFDPIESHREKAQNLDFPDIQNAGFVGLSKTGFKFYGESITLGLGSTGVQGGIFENLHFLFEETSNKWLYLKAISTNKDLIEKVFNTYRRDEMSRYLHVTGKKIHPNKSEEFNVQNVIPIPRILLHDKAAVIKAIEHFFCWD